MFSWLSRSKHASREPSAPPDEPWRAIKWGHVADLQYVMNYEPSVDGQQIRILLHGPAGAGKSSFINSVQSVLSGRIKRQALENNVSEGCFTKKYITYKTRKDRESCYPFVFNDTMGLGVQKGVREDDLRLALKGHVKDGYRFNPESSLPNDEQFYNKSPTPNDIVHVLVCVVPAHTLSLMSDEFIQKIKNVRKEASELNIPQLAILTKFDELCPEMKKDVKHIYKSLDVKTKMEKFSASVGLPMNCIFPVKNYHEEIDLNKDMNSLILSAMKHIIMCGDDFVNFRQDQSS